jgi:catechol 2,3-dioxygenase-like lactoylglutathione lyase family enzyme
MGDWIIDHVQLAIPAGAEEQCDEFFCGLLGFSILEKPELLARRGGRWYQKGEMQLHVGVDPDFRPATKAHPAFVVSDYDAVLAKLRDADVRIIESDEIPGTTRCHIYDCVGNRIELIKPA